MPLKHIPNFRLMIVEDEPDIVLALTHMLTGFVVESFGTLAGALERMRKEPYVHVILLDLNLPNGHGMNTVIRAKAADGDRSIIVVTGMDEESAPTWDLIHAGADEVIRKPFRLDVLLDKVRTAAARWWSRQETVKIKQSLEALKAVASK